MKTFEIKHRTDSLILGKTLLSYEEVISIPDGQVIYMVLPLEDYPSRRVIKRIRPGQRKFNFEDHDLVYAPPHNEYLEPREVSWIDLLNEVGPHDIGKNSHQTRIWIEKEKEHEFVEDDEEPRFITIHWR